MGKKLIVPVFTILVGIAWLLNVMGVMRGVDWVWTLGLATAGILSLVAGGLNKITVVTGPFLLVASVCSLLRQTGRLAADHENTSLGHRPRDTDVDLAALESARSRVSASREPKGRAPRVNRLGCDRRQAQVH